MTRLSACAAALVLALPAGPALGDYRSGVEAWGRGDFAAAAGAFRPAAEAGDAEAQYMMGRLYSLGDGVPRDFVLAWVWFDRAARQGHAGAGDARHSLDQVLTTDQLAEARAQAQPQLAPPVTAPPQAAWLSPSRTPVRPPIAASEADAARPVLLVPRRGAVQGADQQQATR